MQRSILLSLMIWLREAVLVAALVSDDWLTTVQQTEDAMTVAYLGKEKDAEICNTAKRWFDRLFVQTGAKETVYRYFIPSEHERQSSIGFQDIGRENLFPARLRFGEALFTAIDQAKSWLASQDKEITDDRKGE